jgi:mono/diheme cytochrome c family protein
MYPNVNISNIQIIVACACVFLGSRALAEPGEPTNETALASTAQGLEKAEAEGLRRSRFMQWQPTKDAGAQPEPQLALFHAEVRPVLMKACVPCHGPEKQKAKFRVDTLDPDLLNGGDVSWWVEVLGVLGNGEMPPPDEVTFADADRARVFEWLSSEIQLASRVRRAAGGHSSFRRMTRYEYNYTLQDLLGLPWDFARDLPPEAHSEDGFQNSSEMLHMSVGQLETYRRLARKALQRALVPGEQPPALYWGVSMKDAAKVEWKKQDKQLEKLEEKFPDDPGKQQEERERLDADFHKTHGDTYYKDMGSGRTARATWSYPGARYAFSPSDTRAGMPDSFDHVAILPQGHNRRLTIELGNKVPDEGVMRVRVRASRVPGEGDGIPSMQLQFGWQASNEGRAAMRVSSADVAVHATPDAPGIYQWDFPLGDIYPRNSVRHTSKMGVTPSPSEYVRLLNSSASKGAIQVDYVEVSAPVYDTWPPESHQRLFFESEHPRDSSAYAREILIAFMERAWRREITSAEVQRKMALYGQMRAKTDSLEEAMIEVLATVLSSPQLLYVANDPQTLRSPEQGLDPQLSPQGLATRLAIFLWSSVPDARLMALAKDGSLRDPEVLEQEVQRMLEDPRSRRFSRHFVHQWLDMQLLDFLDIAQSIPRFDPLLKEAMQEEPVALFQEILENNQSVLHFIHADYTMANERLARHYGLPGVAGNHFRKVRLDPDHRRGGLLTQAGLLAMNADGSDSHPLKRGIWLLESLLNDPPPPPPPAVPEIDLADPEIAKLSLKERIEDHRNHPACMSCHAKIDPWGIAFENYDAVGKWREDIKGKAVDATSLLFNQQELDGMDGLKRFLLEHRQDQFVRALVYKMSTYALGRPMTFADRAGIDAITADARQQGDGLATLLQCLVTSPLFQAR